MFRHSMINTTFLGETSTLLWVLLERLDYGSLTWYSGDAFQAGNTLFRVHGYFFSRDSPVFSTKLNPVSPGQVREGTTADLPVVLDGITAEEFEILLWVFYNP